MSDESATIPASRLQPLPEALFPRHENSEEHIASLAAALRNGESLPPLLVDPQFRIVDGFHRWQAHVRAHGPEAPVLCIVRKYGSEKEVFLDALRENARHGLRFNASDHNRCAAIAHRLGMAPEEARALHPEALAPLGRGDTAVRTDRRNDPVIRAQEDAERLLAFLGSGQLRQNRTALEKEMGRLLRALDEYLERGQTSEDWRAGV